MKPLSETHPTLFNSLDLYDKQKIIDERWWEGFDIDDVQSCTVDITEHNRIGEEYDNMLIRDGEEIERLKKELFIKQALVILNSPNFNDGVFEGERRAMERVKWAIRQTNFKLQNKNHYALALLNKELSLDEEAQK